MDSSSYTEKKRALLEILRRERSAQTTIPRSASSGPSPVSAAQHRLWFLEQLQPGTSAYNVAVAHHLTGVLDAASLEDALRIVVARHDALRSHFENSGGSPLQAVTPDASFSMEKVDLTHLASEERLGEAIRLATETAQVPFSLTRGPLFRATLYRLAHEEHVLALGVHHIVSDGASIEVLYRELSIAYQAIQRGVPPALPQLPIRYADFVSWQHEQLSSERLRGQIDYWRQSLAGVSPTLSITTDHARPARQTFAGAKQFYEIPRDLASDLRRFSAANGATLFTTLAAVFALLLSRYSGQTDFVIGFPVSGRNLRELENLFGFFINMLPLRVEIPPDVSFVQFVASLGRRVLDASENQDVPLEQIVDALRIDRDPSRTPLFQTVFSLNHGSATGPALPGISAQPLPIDTGTAKFDLALEILDEPTGLYCSLEYNTGLFEDATAARMLRHYERLLRSALSSPSVPVSRLQLLTDPEIREMIQLGGGVQTDFHRERSLPEQFEEIASRTPEAAAVFGDVCVTYAELNQRANHLARHLQGLGMREGSFVGGSFERSLEMLASLVAVLKIGACFVPLDPSYPPERLRFMVEDAGVSFVMSSGQKLESISDLVTVIDVGYELKDMSGDDAKNLSSHVNPESAACVMYTSGSTGRPKGILIPHRAIVRLVSNADWISFTSVDRVAHLSNISFDASLFEIWGALLHGASLVIVPRNSLLEARRFVAELRKFRVSRVLVTTAFFNQIARDIPDAFRTVDVVVFGGEISDARAVRNVLEHGSPRKLLNLYGPTECATVATSYDCGNLPSDALSVPIGKPISNTEVLILDEQLEPTPIGVLGQIHLGGAGLALGYLARPELTRARFIDHPFVPGERLYATGDLGYWRPDGNIEFCGRKDNQIKLRGFRIELDEIEAICRSHPDISDAVVLLRKDAPDNHRIVAFVRGGERLPDPGQVRSYLQAKLPEYMVPAFIVPLESFPITANGKIDRSALKAMPLDEFRKDAIFLPPQSEVEKTIAGIWQEVLAISQVSRTENFFEIGGHSILLLRVQSRLQTVLGRDIPVIALFEHPTVATLAEYLSGAAKTRAAEISAASPDAPEFSPMGDSKQEPIAIIGMAGRFPGADNVDQLWRNLRDGVSGLRFFSDDELETAGVPRDVFSRPNYIKAGGVLDGADLFDARFFGMPPREAEITDPQHRIFLECAHNALENAGCDPQTYAGLIGVFAGSGSGTYIDNVRAHPAISQTAGPLQLLVGNDKDFVPSRVSYKLNLRGPSVNVQTACSTSLVAVHFACRSLSEHACDTALAGGVSIRFPQPSGYPYFEESIMAPDGRCRAFDAEAHGTVPANGAAVVVLKRLSDALADRDHIYAVIKGSAINNDGSLKVGYTAPSIDGQSQVVAAAHARAGVEPSTISYVEAHGTGTHLGDPIEIAALTKAFRTQTDRIGFCAIGSIKSNLGHLDTAAGVTGLIKAALQLQHKQIVPTLHFERPNPKIDFAKSPFFVNTTLRDWESDGPTRRAGVSSFGIGGTNAHVILEEAPHLADPLDSGESQDTYHVLPLSAKTEDSLNATAKNLASCLRENPKLRLADVAYTLQTGRTAHARRTAVVCQGHAEAVEALTSGGLIASLKDQPAPSIAFLFPGQGSQHIGMARDLYDAEPVFRQQLDRCAEILLEHLDRRDIRALIYPDTPDQSASHQLNQTAITQPTLFSVEYAMARLWLSWGVRPDVMIGHSIGEYVAACLAGVMSLRDALRLVARRGRLMQDLPPGAMLAVSMTEQQALEFAGNNLSVAAINAPEMCVLSGPEERIAAAEAQLDGRVFHRRLRTSHAFHSEMVDPAIDQFFKEVRGVQLSPPSIPYLSNVTGRSISAAEATDPAYWASHLRRCVRFSQGIEALLHNAVNIFLEVGPGNTLISLAKPWAKAARLLASVSAKPGTGPDRKIIRGALSQLWTAGVQIDWKAVSKDATGRHIALPTYPFERARYWVDPQSDSNKQSAVPMKGKDVSEWFYFPSWKRSNQVGTAPAAEHGSNWLLCCDDEGVAAQLASDLKARGAVVTFVTRGKTFAVEDSQFTICPSSPGDYHKMMSHLRASGALPDKIVHLWGIAESSPAPSGSGAMVSMLEQGFYSLLWLAEAVAGEAEAKPKQILAVTTGIVDLLGNERSNPLKSPIIGFMRVAGQELNLNCRVMDVDSATAHAILSEQIRAECALAVDGEHVVAYRGKSRWTEHFEHVRLEQKTDSQLLKPRGVYLITGGLGGIALEIAAYLADAVKARLVLIGRSSLPPREEWEARIAGSNAADPVAARISKIRNIEAAGGEVAIISADVANRGELERAIHFAERRFGPIDGVIHAAGIAGGGLIQRQTKESCDAVFAPKIAGTLNLCAVFSHRQLEFFILCSSLRSWIGAPGRADYCAANAFLDAAAQQPGFLPAAVPISIAWDSWAETGMGYQPGPVKELIPGEIETALSNAEGVAAFRTILANPRPAVIVSTIDLNTRIEQHKHLTTERVLQTFAAARQPVSVHTRPKLETEYVAPRTPAENTLAAIWQNLLGINPVGIEDNFFELGGDSVVAIQVVARAHEAGLHFSPTQMFQHQTIADLAALRRNSSSVRADQSPITGEVLLTPIQHWFFEQHFQQPNHFNLAVLLASRERIRVAELREAVGQLQGHHDALRLRFTRDSCLPTTAATTEEAPFEVREFATVSDLELSEALDRECSAVHASLDIQHGPIFRVVLFDCGDTRPQRLLMSVHHLASDLLTLFLLVQDLEIAYTQIAVGHPVRLPQKTTSFQEWSARLTEAARAGYFNNEIEYWTAQSQHAYSLPVDFPSNTRSPESSARIASATLSVEDTRTLLNELPTRLNTTVLAVLLAALAEAISRWAGSPELAVDVEGLGREGVLSGVDLSRTAGWFTPMYPLRLEHRESLPQLIHSVSMVLKNVPSHGIGYGALRYLTGNPDIRRRLDAIQPAAISFLYRGASGTFGSPQNLFVPTAEGSGVVHAPTTFLTHKVAVDVAITEGVLDSRFIYSSTDYRPETMNFLASRYVQVLRAALQSAPPTDELNVVQADADEFGISDSDMQQIAASLLTARI